MGSIGQLEGGEIATMIQAIAGLAGEITRLIAAMEGIPVLEEL
jgi:hypothetical protein